MDHLFGLSVKVKKRKYHWYYIRYVQRKNITENHRKRSTHKDVDPKKDFILIPKFGLMILTTSPCKVDYFWSWKWFDEITKFNEIEWASRKPNEYIHKYKKKISTNNEYITFVKQYTREISVINENVLLSERFSQFS